MAFRFVLGRAGSGKTRYCLDAVAAELSRSPDGPPLILLVPEQATFQMDRALVTLPGIRGTARAQVLSFRRLAWRVLTETGGAVRPHIDETGKAMILRALLSDRKGQLHIFEACSAKPGFLSRLTRTLSELRAYGIRHPELERAYSALSALGRGQTALAAKLHDLALLGRDLEDYLAGRWVDPDDILALLATKLSEHPAAVRGARVWVDGFAGFTGQEVHVILALADAAAEVTVALCLDPVKTRAPGRPGDARGDPSTFHPTLRTYDLLAESVALAGVSLEAPVTLVAEPRPRFGMAPALAHLEREYPNHVPRPYSGAGADPANRPGGGRPSGAPEGIVLVAAESRRAEVAAAAREMVRLARVEGYRWREMALITRSLEPYVAILEATLADYGIPYFIDRRRPAAYHPLIEFVRSAVELAARDWAAEPVFRLLKTDLWPLPRAEVDLLENYVLAHGVRGAAWTQDSPWRWRRVFSLDETAPPDPAQDKTLAQVDRIRREVAGLLGPYVRKLAGDGDAQASPPSSSSGPTFRDRAGALWSLVEAAGVPGALDRWRLEALASGNPARAQEHERVLAGLSGLLDQLAANLGDRPATLTEFGRTLEAGLETLTLALVPPTLDQVVVGAIDRSRQPEVRACFVLGLNDGVFPASSQDDAVFDDRERDELGQAYGFDLAPASREKALGEDYLAYIALTRPSERLWLSYSLASDDGKAMAPSLVVSRLRAIFPALAERRVGLEPREPASLSAEAEVLSRVTRVLAEAYRLDSAAGGVRSPDTPRVDSGWLEAYNWLVAEPGRRVRARVALRSLGYLNRPAPLPPGLAEALTGRPVRVSVSRLESYAGCPFSHFAAAELALQPRPRRQLKAPQIGSYYHAVLSVFTRNLIRDGADVGGLDREALAERLDRAVAEVAPRLESDVLASTARYRHLAGQLKRTVGRAIEVLQEHARRSAFRPVAPELRFALSPGGQAVSVHLRGTIDRLEVAEAGSNLYLRVLDFKSSQRGYSVLDTLYGLSLQLPVYLLAATRSGTEWIGAEQGPAPGPAPGSAPGSAPAPAYRPEFGRRAAVPAGAFFLPVADPYVRARGPLDDEPLARKRLEKVRAKGVVLDDPAVLRLMDRDPAGGAPPAPILPYTLTASGKPRKNKNLLPPDRMTLLLDFTWARLAALAAGMREGKVDIRPARKSVRDSVCRFCGFHPLCRFDPGAGDEFRRLPRLTGEEVWDQMAREVSAYDDGRNA